MGEKEKEPEKVLNCNAITDTSFFDRKKTDMNGVKRVWPAISRFWKIIGQVVQLLEHCVPKHRRGTSTFNAEQLDNFVNFSLFELKFDTFSLSLLILSLSKLIIKKE